MYRILFVDDETEVRESIVRKISWQDYGFKLVGDAENGQDALDKIEVLNPDVIITDIKMPFMDGLELSAAVREKYPSVKMIILSGFGQFEYAQKAIQANVIDYILKPVDTEELKKTLLKTKQFLDEEIEERSNMEALKQLYVKNLPVLREHFLVDLVNGRYMWNQIEQNIKEYELELLPADMWVVSSIDILYTEEQDEGDRRLLPLFVKELLEDQLKGFFKFGVVCSPQEMFVIQTLKGDAGFQHMIRLLQTVCAECKRILNLDVAIGIGTVFRDITKANKSYRESRTALGYRNLREDDKVIYIGDVEPVFSPTLFFSEQDEAELTTVLKFEIKEKEITAVVDRLLYKMEEVRAHKSQYQRYIISLLNTITQIIQKYRLDESAVFGTADIFEKLQELEKPQRLRRWLVESSLLLNRQIREQREKDEHHIIKRTLAYIEENFHNSGLSAEMICQRFHITTAYFSSLFKQETGQNYIVWLTELRMKKAKELLDQTDEKSYKIAEMVGYAESSYFSYVFKKHFGVSPSKYRKNKADE